MTKYTNIIVEITYGYVSISGERDGQRFMTKRLFGRAADVVMHVRNIWKGTGVWPTVCLAEDVRTSWGPLLERVHEIMSKYRDSDHYAITRHLLFSDSKLSTCDRIKSLIDDKGFRARDVHRVVRELGLSMDTE